METTLIYVENREKHVWHVWHVWQPCPPRFSSATRRKIHLWHVWQIIQPRFPLLLGTHEFFRKWVIALLEYLFHLVSKAY